MYVLKITQDAESWLVAISLQKDTALKYLETLSDEMQAHAFCFEIEIKNFPFVVIENKQAAYEPSSYFEFCMLEELQARIDLLRLKTTDDSDHVYFKYYFIDEEYFQTVSEQNYMQYVGHTVVTNDFLEELPYPITVFHETIKKHVSNYDIEGLDELLEQAKKNTVSKSQKEDLALNGYDNLFWTMNYDHACGKLTEKGIEYLLPMVENIEFLLEEKKWQHRSYALHILLQLACKNKQENVFELLKQTIKAFENYLISDTEEKLEIHRLVSLAYFWMIEADPENALLYWQNAVAEIKKAIRFDAEKASWFAFFELIYIPFEDKKICQIQLQEQKRFNVEVQELEKERGAVIAYQIALAYQDLKENIDWKEIKNAFPEETTLHWAEKAATYNPEEVSRINLYEYADFFNKAGSKYKRTDFLEKAISTYERILNSENDRVMEVVYIANLYKEIAEIYLGNKDQILADHAIEQAKSIYENNNENVKSNSSANLHYAEFLEYCFTYEGNIDKPTIAELKSVAREVEIQSEGFLSYPYLLLMRIALYENNEEQAILELTKSLILHELCSDSEFASLMEEFKDFNNNVKLKSFLNETKLFMDEVKENYYYNPEINWVKMQTMLEDELIVYWEKRKEQIRNRPPFDK